MKYYTYDPASGYTEQETAEDAEAWAAREYETMKEGMGDEWPEDIDQIEWGEMTCRGRVELTETGADEFTGKEWEDHHMVPVPREPLTVADAIGHV